LKIRIPKAERLRTGTASIMSFAVPEAYLGAWKILVRKCADDSLMDVEISTPRKKRTTGEHSQNNHAHGHAQQIANETGHDMHEIETIAKHRAIKRGYPFSDVMGVVVPKSQADISTVECGYLIDEYHAIAAELGIILQEADA
jgi:hypothetical protein